MNLEHNILLYTPMLELLRHENYTVIYETDKSLLIHDLTSNIYAGLCEEPKEAATLIESIPTDAEEVLLFHKCLFEEKLKRGVLHNLLSFNSVYSSKELCPVKLPKRYSLKPLQVEHTSFVMEHYSVKDLCIEDHIRERIEAGMLGVFHKENLVGFIGTHLEGALGMLEVLPAYRHQGLAIALQHAMTNELIKQGAYIYGQVMQNNTASFALQKKCNFTICNEPTYWYFQ